MTLHVEATVIIAGEIATVADVEEFLDQARALGAQPEHKVDGFLALQYVGSPSPVDSDGTIRALVPLAQVDRESGE